VVIGERVARPDVGPPDSLSIAVIQPDSRLCPSRIETIPAGRTISYAPPRIRRDARRAGVAATAVADTTFDFSTNKLEATVCVTAVDRRRHATFSGCTVEFLYTTDPDRVIEALPRDPATHVSYRHQPGELSATVRLGEISLVSIADEGCVSPLASKRGEPAPWIGRRARRSTRSCRR